MRPQALRQGLDERLLHPGCGGIAHERAQRLDIDPDSAKPEAALGSRARLSARRKPDRAEEGKGAPAIDGAGDHFPLPLLDRAKAMRESAGRGETTRLKSASLSDSERG